MTNEEKAQVIKTFELYRDYIKHEDSLMAHRLSWLLASTGLIAAAYGSLAAYVLHVFWDLAGKEGPISTNALSVAHHQLILLATLFVFSFVGLANSRFAYRSVVAAKASIESFVTPWNTVVAQYHDIEKLALPALRHGFSDEKLYSVKYSETICQYVQFIWKMTFLVDILISAQAFHAVGSLTV